MHNKINPIVNFVDHKHYLKVYVVSFVLVDRLNVYEHKKILDAMKSY